MSASPEILIGTTAGGVSASFIARRDSTGWHSLGSGLNREVRALAEYKGELFAGGFFTTAGGVVSPGFARWACPTTCYADCDQSTGIGVLDIFDFLCFQNSFVNGEPYACDCDTSTGTVCDIFDFLCFQDAFVGGCP